MISYLAASGGLGETAVELGRTFGWKPAYFVAQVINFAIVLYVLRKFAFAPIQEILEKRRDRIAEGEAKLAEIEQKLSESEKTTAALIEKANQDSKRLIEEAQTSAADLAERKSQEAAVTAQNILSKAEEAAKAERATMAADLKKEFGRLVVATTTQVTGKTLTPDDQKRINDEALTSVQSN